MKAFKDLKIGDEIYFINDDETEITSKKIVSIHPITWTRDNGEEVIDRVYFTFDGIFKNTPDELYYEDAIYILENELKYSYVDRYITDLNTYIQFLKQKVDYIQSVYYKELNQCCKLQDIAKKLVMERKDNE